MHPLETSAKDADQITSPAPLMCPNSNICVVNLVCFQEQVWPCKCNPFSVGNTKIEQTCYVLCCGVTQMDREKSITLFIFVFWYWMCPDLELYQNRSEGFMCDGADTNFANRMGDVKCECSCE